MKELILIVNMFVGQQFFYLTPNHLVSFEMFPDKGDEIMNLKVLNQQSGIKYALSGDFQINTSSDYKEFATIIHDPKNAKFDVIMTHTLEDNLEYLGTDCKLIEYEYLALEHDPSYNPTRFKSRMMIGPIRDIDEIVLPLYRTFLGFINITEFSDTSNYSFQSFQSIMSEVPSLELHKIVEIDTTVSNAWIKDIAMKAIAVTRGVESEKE